MSKEESYPLYQVDGDLKNKKFKKTGKKMLIATIIFLLAIFIINMLAHWWE